MRLVTATDCPDNIHPFTAQNWEEAISKCETAFDEPKIQGAVWLRNSGQKQQLTASTFVEPVSRSYSSDFSYATFYEPEDENPTFYPFASDEEIIAKRSAIRKELEQDILPLKELFARQVEVMLRFQSHLLHDEIHVDGFEKNEPIEKPSNPFKGYPLRAVQTLSGLGTKIYKPDDIETEDKRKLGEGLDGQEKYEAWRTCQGDVVFIIPPLQWGFDKALIHGSSCVNAKNINDARVTKIIDFNINPKIIKKRYSALKPWA